LSSDELLRLVAGEEMVAGPGGAGAGREGGGGAAAAAAGGEAAAAPPPSLPPGLLPRPRPCPGGCSDELYCSPECAAADWGEAEEEEEEAEGEAGERRRRRRGAGSHRLLCGGADPSSPRAAAVDALRELCASANDSLWLACKAVAGVVAESRVIRRRSEGGGAPEARGSGGAEAAAAAEAGVEGEGPAADAALLSAWLPWSFAEKAL